MNPLPDASRLRATAARTLRSLAYRAGRRLYFWARRETHNDPSGNGEIWLLDAVLRARTGSSTVLLDVGAHIGDWSTAAVRSSHSHGVRASIVAFEPCAPTLTELQRRLADNPEVEVVHCAVSNREGTAQLCSFGHLNGANSLHPVSGEVTEEVRVVALDTWLRERGLPEIAMLKIDTEGFDALVLEGADQALRRGEFEVIQFEYNWRWLLNGRSLWSVFEMAKHWPYTLSRLSPGELQHLPAWHPELDRFFEGNYVLLRKGSSLESLRREYGFDASNVLVPRARG